jgi:hypothetical protein
MQRKYTFALLLARQNSTQIRKNTATSLKTKKEELVVVTAAAAAHSFMSPTRSGAAGT